MLIPLSPLVSHQIAGRRNFTTPSSATTARTENFPSSADIRTENTPSVMKNRTENTPSSANTRTENAPSSAETRTETTPSYTSTRTENSPSCLENKTENAPSTIPDVNSYKFSRPRFYVQNQYPDSDLSVPERLKLLAQNVGPKQRSVAYNNMLTRLLQMSKPKLAGKRKNTTVFLNSISAGSGLKLLKLDLTLIPTASKP
jgi:hypothetical protein